MRIEAAGFQALRREGIVLSAGQAIRLPIEMRIGETRETVTVTGETPLVNAVNAEQRTGQGELEARELPIFRRDWGNLLNLNTGAVSRLGGNAFAFNGVAPLAFRFTVDGTNNTQSHEAPSLGLDGDFQLIKGVSLEAIEEVTTTKGIASAQYAGTLSGTINVSTKSGTNQLHGSAFLNNQLEDYNARNQFLREKPGSVFNQYGGSLGGALIRNRLFAFGAYEGYQQRIFQALSGDGPSDEFRAQVLAAVPAYKPIFDLLPRPNQPASPGATNAQFIGAGSVQGSDNHLTVRTDYQVSARDRFAIRYSRGRPFQSNPTIMAENPRTYDGVSEMGTVNGTHSVGRLVSETRFGFNVNSVDRIDARYTAGVPNITGAIGFSGGEGEILLQNGSSVSLEQSFSVAIGRHLIRFGGIWLRQTVGRENVEQPSFSYSSVSDFLSNTPSSVDLTFGVAPFQLRTAQWGGFIQDDVPISRRLSLSLGLRYDYFTVPSERDGRIFNRDAPFGFGALRTADSMHNADRNNFAPRVSFAWSLDSASRTVVRGGAGVFFSPRTIFGGPIELIQTSLDQPFRVTLSRAEALNLGIRFPITNQRAAEIVRGAPPLWTGTSIDPGFPSPYSMQWTLGVQRQMAGSSVLEAAYVGSRALKLNMVRDMNRPDRVTGLRPVAGFGTFRYYDASDATAYHSLQVSFRQRGTRDLSWAANYTYASNISYSDGSLGVSQRPQDNDDLRSNRGPTPFFLRHNFVADWVYQLPIQRWAGFTARPARLLLAGWQVSGILTAQSGAPINVTQSTSYASSRPDYIGGEAVLDDYRTTLRYLNRAAFQPLPVIAASGAAARPGNLGRFAFSLPGLWGIDLGIGKSFAIHEGHQLQFRADLFNALNHTNFTAVVTNINSGSFGNLSAATARTMQLHLRYRF